MTKETVLFEDDFSAGLREGWTWMREEPGAWRVEKGALNLRVLPGTLWGTRNDAKNILLGPENPLQENLTSEVTVINHPENQGEQAGLIWYCNDGCYVKLIKESLEGRVWIVMAREEDDQPALVSKVPYECEVVQLRLSYQGGKMVGQYRNIDAGSRKAGSDAWQTVGECAPVAQGGIHPGIFTHGGAEGVERWAELRGYCLLVAKK